jgi:hypothetical protein
MPELAEAITWDITNLTAWTPAILKSPYLWAMITMDQEVGYYYYLDYLGFMYWWTKPGEAGAWPNGTIVPHTDDEILTPAFKWPSFNWSGGQFLGLLGITGFLGLMLTPALAIWAVRSSDEKEGALLKVFVLGTFFFASLIASIGI